MYPTNEVMVTPSVTNGFESASISLGKVWDDNFDNFSRYYLLFFLLKRFEIVD